MNVSVIAASVFAVMEIIIVANAQPAIQRDALPASGASTYSLQQQEGAARPPGNEGPNAFPPPGDQPGGYAALPPDYRPEVGKPKELPPRLRRQLVDFSTEEPAGTLIVDTPNTYLYLVLGGGKAMRYGVGREGSTPSRYATR